jgi:DNA-binding winged helix-turn-helix (wHTH) protein
MAEPEQPIAYQFGSFVLDLEWGGLISAEGKELPLRPKSFALLRFLLENARRILSHDEIMMALWPNLFVTENNITQCVRDIRRALGPESCQTLQTIARRGYRFTPHVIAIPPVPRTDGTAGGLKVSRRVGV